MIRRAVADTSIEITLRKALWKEGIRYRKNYKGLPSKSDIVLTKYKIAVFCDSEFFHGKDWDELRAKFIMIKYILICFRVELRNYNGI